MDTTTRRAIARFWRGYLIVLAVVGLAILVCLQ